MKSNLLLFLLFGLFQPGLAASVAPDVVVYSGVPAGIAAAITAAREGARVVLVEPTLHVGGLSTSGINTAETEHMLPWTIGGFADEFYRSLGKHYGTGNRSITSSRVSPSVFTWRYCAKRASRCATARRLMPSARTARESSRSG